MFDPIRLEGLKQRRELYPGYRVLADGEIIRPDDLMWSFGAPGFHRADSETWLSGPTPEGTKVEDHYLVIRSGHIKTVTKAAPKPAPVPKKGQQLLWSDVLPQ